MNIRTTDHAKSQEGVGQLVRRAEVFNIKIPSKSRSVTLELSFRISLKPGLSLVLPQLHVNHRSSDIFTTCQGSVQALQIPHKMGVSPIVKEFFWDDIEDLLTICGPSLMVALRNECSMDFITYDLEGDSQVIQTESQASRLRSPGFGSF